mgnify:CR=1 FL=1
MTCCDWEMCVVWCLQARSRQGNASSAIAATISSDAVLESLANTALGIIDRNSSSSSSAGGGRVSLQGVTSNFGSSSSSKGVHSVTSNIPRVSSNFGSSGGSSGSSNGGSSGGSSGSSGVLRGPTRAAGLGEASPKAQELLVVLQGFMEQHVYPAEHILEEHATGNNRCGNCISWALVHRQFLVLGRLETFPSSVLQLPSCSFKRGPRGVRLRWWCVMSLRPTHGLPLSIAVTGRASVSHMSSIHL